MPVNEVVIAVVCASASVFCGKGAREEAREDCNRAGENLLAHIYTTTYMLNNFNDKVLLFAYKVMQGFAPQYLHDILEFY